MARRKKLGRFSNALENVKKRCRKSLRSVIESLKAKPSSEDRRRGPDMEVLSTLPREEDWKGPVILPEPMME